MTTQTEITQSHGEQTLTHVLVEAGDGGHRPGVVIVPTVMGVSPLELGFAEKLVALGYNVLVADTFGRRFQTGVDRDAAFAAMGALKGDRAALRDMLLGIVDAAREQPSIESGRLAVIGYCFGGLCALDVARAGADIAGAASFHGLFDPPGLPPQPIKAKVLALHGWDDPMVPPEAVAALGKELTDGGADWQIHAYGHTGHGFTNPNAHQIGIAGVAYQEAAARRSWAALEDFLAEVLA
jgi:dienelactone hydrolase